VEEVDWSLMFLMIYNALRGLLCDTGTEYSRIFVPWCVRTCSRCVLQRYRIEEPLGFALEHTLTQLLQVLTKM